MVKAFTDILQQAAQLNRDDRRRRGNLVELSDAQEVLVAGDLHGHRANLARIIEYADLSHHEERVLVLQELIHGPAEAASGHDRSIDLLMRAARLKVAHPRGVLFLLGNHDIAQVTGNEITKEGRGVVKAFEAGTEHAFGPDAVEITPAMEEFLLSLPLAIRCPNGVLLSHSLPAPDRMAKLDPTVLRRSEYTSDDLKRGGGAYEWTWGRNQQPAQLEELGRELGVSFFVLGHRHAESGYELIPDRGLSVASDTDRGCILQFTLQERLTLENIRGHLKMIGALKK